MEVRRMLAAAALGARPGAGANGRSLGLGLGDKRPTDIAATLADRTTNMRLYRDFLESILTRPSIKIEDKSTGFQIWVRPGIEALTPKQKNAISNMSNKITNLTLSDQVAEAFGRDPSTGRINALYYLKWFLDNLDTGGTLPYGNGAEKDFWRHDYTCRGSLCGRLFSWVTGSGRRNTRKSKSKRSQRNQKSQRKTRRSYSRKSA